jgi:CheY-like chemotaxis protein
MSDRVDADDKTAFVLSLPRKMTELRATLGTIVADTRSSRMRDELRRRLHALYTSARGFELGHLSEGLREGIAHLDALRASASLGQRDLDTLSEFIASLSTLAQKDLPDRPDLFERPRDRGPAALSSSKPTGEPALVLVTPAASTGSGDRAPPPGTSNASPTKSPSIAPPAASAGAKSPSVRPPSFNAGAPVGVLVVGGAGLVSEVRRASPKDAEITAVRTLAEAIVAARDAAPDVIVAESVQPADGAGIIASLRGDPLTDFIPVLIVASPAERLDEHALKQQGAFDVLHTPLNPAQLSRAIARAVETLLRPSMPPPSFGDLTLEELTKALQEEIRRGLMGAAGPAANNARVPLGQGTEVLAATWEAIARVREVVARRTHGRVRFEMPSAPLGMGGAHVLAVGDDDESLPESEGDDPLPSRRALVVDDEPNVVWFFANLLREAGMEVIECTDGAQALRDARKSRPDVIISDILMPGMDGFTLCRAIRRDVSLRYTPVVLLSWREDLITRMRELGAQAQGYLRKESKGEAILARVRSVLRPRVRLLRRIESLADGEEVRGRVERLGVFTLIEVAARALRGATITVTDSFSVSEVEVRGGRLVSVLRTAEDGSLTRGESALVQVLGASAARFSLKRATHAVRSNVHGELATLLEDGASLIAALEDAVSGASLVEVASLDIDAEAARAYGKTLPAPMRALIEKLADGDSPRELVLRDGVTPQDLDPLLVELARRGVIRGAKGPGGEDLVAPRVASHSLRASTPPPSTRVSTSMPAVLLPDSLAQIHRKPERVERAETEAQSLEREPPATSREDQAPQTSASSPPARTSSPSWKRPTNVDEALSPGFGEPEKDSLAEALLAELRATDGETKQGRAIVEASDEAEERDEAPVPLETMKVSAVEVSEALFSPKSEAVERPVDRVTNAAASVEPIHPSVEPTDSSEATRGSSKSREGEDDAPIELRSIKGGDGGRVPFSMEPPEPESGDMAPTGVAIGEGAEPRPREVSGERPSAGAIVDDAPEFEVHEGEAELSDAELRIAAESSPGLPLENVELDARGLPRRRLRTEDKLDPADDHKPQPVSTSDSSIIIDVAAVGAPVEVKEPPPRKGETTGERAISTSGPSPWLWLLVAVVGLGLGSYYVVRALLPPPPAPSSAPELALMSNDAEVVAADVFVMEDDRGASIAAVERGDVPAESTAFVVDEDASVVNEASSSARDGSAMSPAAGLEFDLDPMPFLDGSTLAAGRGLLVVEGSGRVTVGTRDLGEAPLRVELPVGQHNLTYHRGNVRGFRVIEVDARRAVRLVLPNDS